MATGQDTRLTNSGDGPHVPCAFWEMTLPPPGFPLVVAEHERQADIDSLRRLLKALRQLADA